MPAGLQAGSSTPANRPIRTARPPAARHHHQPRPVALPRRTKPLAKAILVPSGDQVGCSSSARLRRRAVAGRCRRRSRRRARRWVSSSRRDSWRAVAVGEGDKRETGPVRRPRRGDPVQARSKRPHVRAVGRQRRRAQPPRPAPCRRLSREKTIALPSGDQAGERSKPPARSCAGRCPRAFTVNSEIAGATTEATRRVKAMRLPSGETLGITSNGPLRERLRDPACRRHGVQAEAVVAPVGQVPLEYQPPAVRRPGGPGVAAEVLARRRHGHAAQTGSVWPHRVETADAAVLEPEGDPALRGRAVRVSSRACEERCCRDGEHDSHSPSIRARFASGPMGDFCVMRGNGRFVFGFDEPSEGGRELLGGKGIGLAEMTQLGVPVPAGFTITTDACRAYMQNGKQLPDGLGPEIEQHMDALEQTTGKRFGDSADPLLVSVRSGAAVSMPGMMDTILNLGLNDDAVEGLGRSTDNPRFACDSYRRLIQMYGEVVEGIDAHRFESGAHRSQDRPRRPAGRRAGRERPPRPGRHLQADLRGRDGLAVPAGRARAAHPRRAGGLRVVGHAAGAGLPPGSPDPRRPRHRGQRRPDGLRQQGRRPRGRASPSLATPRRASRGSTASSSRMPRARTWSPESAHPSRSRRCRSSSRRPSTSSSTTMRRLEEHYRDMQDIEFTVEDGRLYLLQTRSAKRTAAAALKAAVSMTEEGLISREEAVARIDPDQLDQLLHPMDRPDHEARRRRARAERLPRRGLRQDRARRRHSPRSAAGGRERDPRPLGDDPGRHPRPDPGERDPDRPRRA